MLTQIMRFSARHKRGVVAAYVVATVAFSVLAARVRSDDAPLAILPRQDTDVRAFRDVGALLIASGSDFVMQR